MTRGTGGSHCRVGRFSVTGWRSWRLRNVPTASRARQRWRTGRCGTGSHSRAHIRPSPGIPMPTTHRPMKLSPEEETFLRRWMYDEVHYQEGPGPAKRLQVAHRVPPADLAAI